MWIIRGIINRIYEPFYELKRRIKRSVVHRDQVKLYSSIKKRGNSTIVHFVGRNGKEARIEVDEDRESPKLLLNPEQVIRALEE